MSFEITDVWPRMEQRLEAGERITKAEIVALLRSYPLGPPIVSTWLADALEDKLQAGRPRHSAVDDLKNPLKMAALDYKWIRGQRKRKRDNWRGTAGEDLEAVAERHSVDLESLAIEVRRAKPKRSKK